MAQKKQYQASQKVLDAESAMQAQKKEKPEFQWDQDGELSALLDEILNSQDFSYRLDGDALYRQYRNQAVENGRLAMADTMGQAAALTGGYANSYAQSVGQQAYNRELGTLADRIPELYSLAMEQYQMKNQNLKDKYDLLSGQKKDAFDQYQTSLSAWQTEANQLWKAYADARDADYDAYRDEVEDWQWQQEQDESRRRYDQQWEAEHPTANMYQNGVYYGGTGSKTGTTGSKTDSSTKTAGTTGIGVISSLGSALSSLLKRRVGSSNAGTAK